MLIYSMKPGHDGSVALIDTDTQDLVCSFEAKKTVFRDLKYLTHNFSLIQARYVKNFLMFLL